MRITEQNQANTKIYDVYNQLQDDHGLKKHIDEQMKLHTEGKGATPGGELLPQQPIPLEHYQIVKQISAARKVSSNSISGLKKSPRHGMAKNRENEDGTQSILTGEDRDKNGQKSSKGLGQRGTHR